MLIRTWIEGEAIVMKLPNGEQIKVVLTEYKGQQTKIGIDAPDDVLILRKELCDNLKILDLVNQ